MWRTLREIGLYGDPYGGVDHEYVDASTRDLDPVDRTTAGRIDPKFILDKVNNVHSRLSFVLPALLLITAEVFTSFPSHSSRRDLSLWTTQPRNGTNTSTR